MNKAMLIKILTALAIIAVVIPPFIFGGVLMSALVFFVALFGINEICSVFDGKKHWALTVLFTAMSFTTVLLPVRFYPVCLAVYMVLVFAMVMFNEEFSVDRAMYTYTLSVIVILACRSILNIYTCDLKFFGMMFVAIACYMCDTGAYFFGVFTGKHKMIPRISPNKTWEGAIGGYVTGALTSGIFGVLTMKSVPVSMIITAALVLPAVGALGDLAFSAVKRHFHIKDFGNLLPGHGGILDRVDSLVFCLMVFNALLIVWEVI